MIQCHLVMILKPKPDCYKVYLLALVTGAHGENDAYVIFFLQCLQLCECSTGCAKPTGKKKKKSLKTVFPARHQMIIMLKLTGFKTSETPCPCIFRRKLKHFFLFYFFHSSRINHAKLEITFGLRMRTSNFNLAHLMLVMV